MTVTFCGHAQISQSEKIEKWLYDVTKKLIEQGATTFTWAAMELLTAWQRLFCESRKSGIRRLS